MSESADAAFFSPGDACWQHIVHRLSLAHKTADLCVFTITDDRISRAIMDAHRRGVKLRIISDAEKAHDLALVHSEIDVLQCLDAAIELVDVLHADEFVGHRAHVPDWCRRSSQEWSAIMPRMMAPMKML